MFINLIYSQVYAQSDFKVGVKYGRFLRGSILERHYHPTNSVNLSVLKKLNKTSDIILSISYIPLKNISYLFNNDYEKYIINISADYKFNYNLDWIERLNLFAKGGIVLNHSKENQYSYKTLFDLNGERTSYNRFGINIGVGSDYLLTKFLKLEISTELNQLFTKENTMSFGIVQGGLIYIF
jgi:hypothetical protein